MSGVKPRGGMSVYRAVSITDVEIIVDRAENYCLRVLESCCVRGVS
jgi:hypothetical protein